MKENKLKCTDLRIGNYLKYDDEIIQVSVLCKNYVKFYDKEDLLIGDNPTYFEPIELTEELMLKIGFKKERQLISNLFYLDYETDVDNIIRVKYVIYPKAPSLLKITTSQCGNYECFEFMKRGIKYLHELQNAYYCLTNEELKVEL